MDRDNLTIAGITRLATQLRVSEDLILQQHNSDTSLSFGAVFAYFIVVY